MEADLISLEKLRGGDEEGLKELMSRHRESLFRFVYRYVLNETDAAEVTEETFYRVYKNADRFKAKAKVVTWIYSIAGNLCRDFNRRNQKHRGTFSIDAKTDHEEQGELGDSLASNECLPNQQAVSQEKLKLIEQAIHQLPHKLKFPFIFCVLENNSYDDCAVLLNASRKTVEMRIYRARKLLQGELAELLS